MKVRPDFESMTRQEMIELLNKYWEREVDIYTRKKATHKRWIEKNPERAKELAHKQYEKSKQLPQEELDRRKQKMKQWYQNNREMVLARMKEYREQKKQQGN
jgi:hypothetical protein